METTLVVTAVTGIITARHYRNFHKVDICFDSSSLGSCYLIDNVAEGSKSKLANSTDM